MVLMVNVVGKKVVETNGGTGDYEVGGDVEHSGDNEACGVRVA